MVRVMPAEGRTSIALNGRIVEVGPAAVVEREGRRFRTFELRAAFLPQSAGAIAVPESRLRFAYATRFREDFVNGRVPEDRVDAYVRAEPLDLTVRELPLVGQTTDFRGAVGSFTVSALAERGTIRQARVTRMDRWRCIISGRRMVST